MERNRKIEILESIASGSISVEILQPCKAYFFTEVEPGVYELNGKLFTQNEYDLFCQHIAEISERRCELLGISEFDVIICIRVPGKKEPLIMPERPVEIATEQQPEVEKPVIEETPVISIEEADKQRAEKIKKWKRMNSEL